MPSDDNIELTLHDLSRELENDPDALAVAVRGSYVTRLMTPTSDVDCFVITSNRGPESRHLERAGIDFHVRWFPERYLRYEISEFTLRYIGFFRDSRPLTDKHGTYARLAAECEALDNRRLAQWWLAEVRHQVADAKGQLATGNIATSLYLCRYAAHLLAWTSLLLTSTPTYKHKDVITLLVKSDELADVKTGLLDVMNLEAPDVLDVRERLRLLETLCFRSETRSD